MIKRRDFVMAAAGIGAAVSAPRALSNGVRVPGIPMSEVGQPASGETLRRTFIASQPGTAGSGASRTPLGGLDGIITPARLHFERHHSGVPEIDAESHSVSIYGEVRSPKRLSMDDLLRYPRTSRVSFIECSGNSRALANDSPQDFDCAQLHGLISNSEWVGVPLRVLLQEAGVARDARWVVCEGADACRMTRSIPIEKAMDDAMLALYQNGERLRMENGYPVRLLLPGWEGNTSIKWLKNVRVSMQPAMSREETSKYSDLRSDGSVEIFTFTMGVKSLITSPSPGQKPLVPGPIALNGVAWSGHGKVKQVEVSVDGGRQWRRARLESPVFSKSLTRFRFEWDWSGNKTLILSRATDDAGHMQPDRTEWLRENGRYSNYHMNAMQCWILTAQGLTENAYV